MQGERQEKSRRIRSGGGGGGERGTAEEGENDVYV